MEKKYVCIVDDRREEFMVTKPESDSMEVTKDECSVVISADRRLGEYVLKLFDGESFIEERMIKTDPLNSACKMILNGLYSRKIYQKLCYELEDLYNNKLPNQFPDER